MRKSVHFFGQKNLSLRENQDSISSSKASTKSTYSDNKRTIFLNDVHSIGNEKVDPQIKTGRSSSEEEKDRQRVKLLQRDRQTARKTKTETESDRI